MGQEHGSEPLKQIQKWILIFLYVIDIKALSSRPEVEPNGLLEVALSSRLSCRAERLACGSSLSPYSISISQDPLQVNTFV